MASFIRANPTRFVLGATCLLFPEGFIAGDEQACAFEYVQYGTDANVPKEIQCGRLINSYREMCFMAKP
jgi:hypothetical protein